MKVEIFGIAEDFFSLLLVITEYRPALAQEEAISYFIVQPETIIKKL